jgi:GntR family transcriptional regulator
MEFADRGAHRLSMPRNIEEGTVQYLADTLHIHQIGYRDWVAVRAPDTTEAEYFRLPPDGRTSIIEIARTAFDGNEQPMRLTVTVYPADRNQLVFDFGQVPDPDAGREM